MLPDRAYGSWAEMLEREAALPADVRIEAVSIVTPNHMHAPPAIAAMEAGFDVIIDKPLADTLEAMLRRLRRQQRAPGAGSP